jgi:hypothetical protein
MKATHQIKPHEGDAAKQIARRQHTKPNHTKATQQIKPHQGHPKTSIFTKPKKQAGPSVH